jgi:hypothetical protein
LFPYLGVGDFLKMRVIKSFRRIFLLGILGCAEATGPASPLTVPAGPSFFVSPPSASGVTPDIFTPTDPSFTLTLPTFAEQVVVEFQLDGIIDIPSANPLYKGSHQADGSGFFRSDGFEGCYVNIKFTFTLGSWGPGPCSANPFHSQWVDTALIQGSGTLKRGGKIPQWDWECGGGPCWYYSGVQTYSVRPLQAFIDLTTPGTSQPSPGYIDRPAPGNWTLFKVAANPLRLKNIDVPIRVLSWQWTAAAGGPGQTILTGSATAIQRSAYITENGRMVVSAVVNGREQTDTVRVGMSPDTTVPPDTGTVTVVPAATWVKPTIILEGPSYIPRHDTSRVNITVSVKRANGTAIPSRDVTLTLTPVEGTAGHLHIGSPAKPAGLLNEQTGSVQINTGSSGVTSVTFRAPEPSGPVTISGTSTGSTPGSATITVKVPGLVKFFNGPYYELIGGDTHSGKHSDNHYALQEHIDQLKQLAVLWHAKYGFNLEYNDASLVWGGLFDYDWENTPWHTPHGGHREGKHTDLRQIGNPAKGYPPMGDRRLRQLKRFWEDSLHGEVHVEGDHRHLVYPK